MQHYTNKQFLALIIAVQCGLCGYFCFVSLKQKTHKVAQLRTAMSGHVMTRQIKIRYSRQPQEQTRPIQPFVGCCREKKKRSTNNWPAHFYA